MVIEGLRHLSGDPQNNKRPRKGVWSHNNMSEYGNITAQPRDKSGKGVSRKLRAAGRIPGVMYGRGKDSLKLSIDPQELRKAIDPERKLNTFFTVDIEGGDKESCVIADCQIEPTKDTFMHVDFLRVDPELEVFVKIPVRYFGRAAGVALGGKLKTTRREIRVAAKPAEVPVELAVDLSSLEIGGRLLLSDLPLENARLLERPDTVMALIDAPKKRDEDKGKGK